MSNPTTINIQLPLPLDVASTLIRMIGTVYPSARMKANDGKSEFMSLEIDLSERAAEGDLETILADFEPDVIDPSVGEITYSKYGVEPPQWLAQAIGAVAAEHIADADNYKETTFHLVHKQQKMVLTVARSEEQTPHALRLAAEQRVRDLEEALREAGVDPDTV